MPLKVRDICSAMEAWAPTGLAYEWDKIGLSIGDPEARVKTVLTCLTVTEAVLQAAQEKKAQLVVSHHPLIWEPLQALRTDDPHAKLCMDFAKAGIACFAAHTNLDLAEGGVNDVLAKVLGLQDIEPLLPVKQNQQLKVVTFVPESHLDKVMNAMAAAGAGGIGNYTHCSFSNPGTGTFKPEGDATPFSGTMGKVNHEPEQRLEMLVPQALVSQLINALMAAHPYEEVAYDLIPLQNRDDSIGIGRKGVLAKPITLRTFAKQVKEALKVDHLRFVGDPGEKVQTIGVMGGSGGGEIARLSPALDVLVTGDVSYHHALDAQEKGIAVIDGGHDGTEKGIVPEITRYLRKSCKGLKCITYREPKLFRPL